jgi:flagellar motor switch protein FliM
MSDLLSPDQIAELVAAAKSGDAPPAHDAPPSRRPRRVRDIDFSRPTKLSPVEQRRFERSHATFCRTASLRLSTELRSQIELEVINSAQLTWSTALRDVPQPSILAALATVPGEGKVGLCLEQSLVFRMIELMIGGSGDHDTPLDRSATEIELALARRIFQSLVASLSIVWQDMLGLSLSLVELESQNASVELVPPSEPTLVLTVETRDETASSTISLLVPYASIAAASERLRGKSTEEQALDRDAAVAMRSAIGAVGVELRAELGATELTIGEVLALGEGDIVRLGAAGSAGVFLGDTRLRSIRPGRSGKHRAVQIVEPGELTA